MGESLKRKQNEVRRWFKSSIYTYKRWQGDASGPGGDELRGDRAPPLRRCPGSLREPAHAHSSLLHYPPRYSRRCALEAWPRKPNKAAAAANSLHLGKEKSVRSLRQSERGREKKERVCKCANTAHACRRSRGITHRHDWRSLRPGSASLEILVMCCFVRFSVYNIMRTARRRQLGQERLTWESRVFIPRLTDNAPHVENIVISATRQHGRMRHLFHRQSLLRVVLFLIYIYIYKLCMLLRI